MCAEWLLCVCVLQARGEMQLAVVIEKLRREGMELAVSPPQVLYRYALCCVDRRGVLGL